MSSYPIHICSGDLWAGAEAQVHMQLSALSQDPKFKDSLGAIIFNHGELEQKLTASGVPVWCFEESLGFLKLCRQSFALLRKEKPSHIVSHGYKEAIVGFLSSQILRIPQIVVFHGLAEQHSGWKGLRLKLFANTERFIARHFAKQIVTVSGTLAKELGFDGLPKLKVIRNCALVPDLNSPDSLKSLLTKPAIVIVGRLVKIKRIDIAIQAMKNINQAQLYIIGNGPEEASLKKLVDHLELTDRIQFLGYRTDASNCIQAADILLLTSDHEGLPTVVLEAFCANTPIVATRLEGLEEIIPLMPDFPFLLFERGNYIEAGQALNKLLGVKNTISKSAIKQHQTNFTKHFSPSAAADSHRNLYNNS